MKKKIIGLILVLSIMTSMTPTTFATLNDRPRSHSILPPFDIMMRNK